MAAQSNMIIIQGMELFLDPSQPLFKQQLHIVRAGDMVR